MTANEKQSLALKKKIRKQNAFFQIGYMKRFHTAFQKLLQTTKEFDDIRSAEINLLTYKPASIARSHPAAWQFSPEKAGGYLLPLCGSHLIDITRFLFKEIKKVEAIVKFWPDKRDYSVNALFKTTTKIPVFYNISIVHFKGLGQPKGEWEEQITVNGSNGRITLKNPAWQGNLPIELTTNTEGRSRTEKIMDNEWQKQMNAFADGIKKDKVIGANAEDGYKVDKIMAAIYKSNRKHKPVRISD
jgi:predicted dehydrogenase